MTQYYFKCDNNDCDFEIKEHSVYSLKTEIEEKGGFLYFEIGDRGYLVDGDCPECGISFQFEI